MNKSVSVKEMMAILKDQQAALMAMNNQLKRLELQMSEIGKNTDYSEKIYELKMMIKDYILFGGTKQLRETLHQQNLTVEGMTETIQSQHKQLEQYIASRIEQGVDRSIQGKQKPYIVTGVILFIISVFLLFVATASTK